MIEPGINAPEILEACKVFKEEAEKAKYVQDERDKDAKTESNEKLRLFIWDILEWIVKQYRSIKLTYALIRQPKTLILTQNQAEYVCGLFLGGVNPENIARAMASMYGREAFPYFQIVNEKMDGLCWSAIDFDIQGLELVRSAMITLGALTVKPDGDYYETSHPMVKYLAGKIITATMPEQKGAR